MEERYKLALEITEKFGQEHLLKHFDKLTKENKEVLINQILDINFNQMQELYNNAKITGNKEQEKIEPIGCIIKKEISNQDRNRYKKAGEEVIRNREFAVVTMAGGQGTRLGQNGPKGTFYLGTNPDMSLFEILCNKLITAKKEYNVEIPWYIMTSEENNDDTVKFFEKNNYFNYNKNKIRFFKQGTLPMMLTNGKIILNEKGLIKLAADGHGGIFEAMFKNNIVEEMKSERIKWIFIGPVDNPLVNSIDPIMIGVAIEKGALGVGKSLIKSNAQEKVGVFCKKNKKTCVIEYTEISKEMAEAKKGNGDFLYGEAHINCNMFNISAIEEIGNRKLPYHLAIKKSKYMDDKGDIIEPEEPNAYKYESFIFDSFEKVKEMAVLRVEREEEFAPIKNLTGIDSAETARELFKKFNK